MRTAHVPTDWELLVFLYADQSYPLVGKTSPTALRSELVRVESLGCTLSPSYTLQQHTSIQGRPQGFDRAASKMVQRGKRDSGRKRTGEESGMMTEGREMGEEERRGIRFLVVGSSLQLSR